MLSGHLTKESRSAGDFRSSTPRFQGDAYNANVELVGEITAIARSKECEASQVALAWVLSRGPHIMAIPGTTKIANLKTNLGAHTIELTDEELALLDLLADKVAGNRYDEGGMSSINA